WRTHQASNGVFERFRRFYGGFLALALRHRLPTVGLFGAFAVASVVFLFPRVGQDFFPQVDAGQIRLHVRAPAGTRLEETESYFARVEDTIRKVIPARELSDILDNIGLPYSGLNIALGDSATVGAFDGEILVSLHPDE